jgi:hypothetical protein
MWHIPRYTEPFNFWFVKKLIVVIPKQLLSCNHNLCVWFSKMIWEK